MIAAMFRENSDFAGLVISDRKRMTKEDVRTVGEPDEDALVGREVDGREAVAIFAAPLVEVLPET